MDEYGITPDQYASGLEHMWITSYLYSAALSLFTFDSFCLVSREASHIHSGKWTFIRTIYLSLRFWTATYVVFALYVWTHNYIPAPVCTMYFWFRGISIDIILTAMVKILLVLRLRALWKGSLLVTIVLLLATTAEIVVNSFSTLAVGIINQKYMIDRFPLWSCYSNDMPPHETHILHVAQSGVSVCRLVVASIELMLTLAKLVGGLRTVRPVGDTLLERIKHIKNFTPIIYIFYRDGTLFFIPFSVMAVFALLSVLYNGANGFNTLGVDWTPWIAVIYYLCGTRLILNIREANCKLTQSMFSRPEFSALRFQATRHGETSGTFSEDFGEIIEERR